LIGEKLFAPTEDCCSRRASEGVIEPFETVALPLQVALHIGEPTVERRL